MSHPQPKLSEYTEFHPKPERRTPLPITNLPVNAISEDADPTLEIRTLIEQLQQTAREARTQMRATEHEKDALEKELARAGEQLETLRENERALRSHFVEVTSLIQERDTALDESERRAQALAESAKKLDAAARERSEAQRQRDEALRQREETGKKLAAFSRASDEQGRLIGETQKQILSIRQARDGAHAQVIDLTNKLTHAEDDIANIDYQRELAEKTAKQATAEAAEFRRQLEATASDRDATARQVEDLTRELDEQRKKLLDLGAQKSAVLQADGEHVAALAEAREQVLSITTERDAARNRAQEQARELEEVRGQFQKFRDEEVRQSAQALAEAHEKLAALEVQARDSRHRAKNLEQQLVAAGEQLAALQTLGETARVRHAEAQRQLEALTDERAAAQTALDGVRKEMDGLIFDRDNERAKAGESALAGESQIAVLRSQIGNLESGVVEARAREADLALLRKRFEKQRVETIELAARLQSGQREIRELSATLAEARLQVKFATAANRATKSGATKSDFAGLVSNSSAAVEPPSEPPAPGLEETLSEKDVRSALSAMKNCFQSFMKTPSDLSLLNELHCHVHGFSERARTTGHLAVHRLCAAFSELTRGLYEIPEQVNPSTLRTVQNTIDFLGALMKDRAFAQAKDPAQAIVYAVDDDLENCDAIRMALETASMRTTCAQQPAVALAELSAARCDLIILDLNLPEMDGFELCQHIRELPLHAATPIVFLTGLATLENRVQSTLSGASDFIGKPFHLHELSVKAMTLILKTQLGIA